MTKHLDPVCSATCAFIIRVSLPKCWFCLVSRPWKAKNEVFGWEVATFFRELHLLQRMLELRIQRISWCRKWWSRCCRTWDAQDFLIATGWSRYQYKSDVGWLIYVWGFSYPSNQLLQNFHDRAGDPPIYNLYMNHSSFRYFGAFVTEFWRDESISD